MFDKNLGVFIPDVINIGGEMHTPIKVFNVLELILETLQQDLHIMRRCVNALHVSVKLGKVSKHLKQLLREGVVYVGKDGKGNDVLTINRAQLRTGMAACNKYESDNGPLFDYMTMFNRVVFADSYLEDIIVDEFKKWRLQYDETEGV